MKLVYIIETILVKKTDVEKPQITKSPETNKLAFAEQSCLKAVCGGGRSYDNFQPDLAKLPIIYPHIIILWDIMAIYCNIMAILW